MENSNYNIVRNHIYEFEILSIAGDNLVLEYEVADWDAEDWGDGKDFEEHDLAYPTYHNPVVPEEYLALSSDKLKDYKITSIPTMYYNSQNIEKGAFECFFQILTPATVKWKPVIMGSKENYRIRVYDHTTNKLVFDTDETTELQANLGVCGSNAWYRILVFPLSDKGAGTNDIDFGITYYQQWTEQYINLYINGEYDHIRWPESGDNPKLIKIKHIAEN